MVETLGLLIPICALSLVCIGLLAVAAVIGVRFLGFSMPGLLGPLGDFLDGEVDDVPSVPQTTRRRRTGLRDQPIDLDFDAAVARHQADKDSPRPSTSPSPFDAQNMPPADDFPTPSRRRRRRDRYDDDEIHGGLLDEDGDGDVDF